MTRPAAAHRAAHEVALLRPTPPAIRIFDAGMGDGTVLSRLMRNAHRAFPTVPMMVVAKEISLEDVRLGLEKMPDRFHEHPATVLVVTNLNYSEAPRLMTRDVQAAAALNWQEVRLSGNSADEQLLIASRNCRPRWTTAGRPSRVPSPAIPPISVPRSW